MGTAASTGQEEELRGVGGWLRFLCIALTKLAPAGLVLQLIAYWIGYNQTHGYAPSIGHGQWGLPLLGDIVVIGFGMFVGWLLGEPDRGAVKMVKIYLASAVAYALVRPLLTYYAWDESSRFFRPLTISGAYQAATLAIIFAVVSAVLWWAYLDKSRRVRNTITFGRG